MMKIVPASRLGTEVSAAPPIIDRSRAIAPWGRAVAGGACITATAKFPGNAAKTATIRSINDSLRFGWALLNSATHNHRALLSKEGSLRLYFAAAGAAYGSPRPVRNCAPGGDDQRSIQIDIEFVSAVAADQCQF